MFIDKEYFTPGKLYKVIAGKAAYTLHNNYNVHKYLQENDIIFCLSESIIMSSRIMKFIHNTEVLFIYMFTDMSYIFIELGNNS